MLKDTYLYAKASDNAFHRRCRGTIVYIASRIILFKNKFSKEDMRYFFLEMR